MAYDLKKLFAASFDARFLVIAACNRSISEVISAMRSASSSTDSKDRSCPISWVIFFRGLSSSSIAMRCPPGDLICFLERVAVERLPAGIGLAKPAVRFLAFGQRQSRTNHGKAARANDRHRHQQARRPRGPGAG